MYRMQEGYKKYTASQPDSDVLLERGHPHMEYSEVVGVHKKKVEFGGDTCKDASVSTTTILFEK